MPLDTSKKDKIFADKYDSAAEPVIIEIPAAGEDGKHLTGVFIGSSKNTTFIIQGGKMKNLTIQGCTGCGIVFEDCITVCEVISSKKCQIQAKTTCGTFTIDKSEGVTFYLPDASINGGNIVKVVSSLSTGTNCCYTDVAGAEDQVEKAIPDQIESVFAAGAVPVHGVVIPDAE